MDQDNLHFYIAKFISESHRLGLQDSDIKEILHPKGEESLVGLTALYYYGYHLSYIAFAEGKCKESPFEYTHLQDFLKTLKTLIHKLT